MDRVFSWFVGLLFALSVFFILFVLGAFVYTMSDCLLHADSRFC